MMCLMKGAACFAAGGGAAAMVRGGVGVAGWELLLGACAGDA